MRRPISVLTREGIQHMRKHIDRVLLVGATVVLLAFGPCGIALPVNIGCPTNDAAPSPGQTGQTSSE